MAITVDKVSIGNNTNMAGAGGTVSFTTTQTVSSNAFIVVCVSQFADTTALASVAGGGLSWTIDKNSAGGDVGTSRVFIASAQAPSGLASGTTITATCGGGFGGNGLVIGGMSFLGVKTSSPLDGTPPAKNGMNGVTDWNTNSQTIQNGSVMVGYAFCSATTGTNTPVSALEAWEINDVPNTSTAVMEYRIEPTGGSFNIAGTLSATGNVGSANAAYLAAPASQTSQLTADHGLGMGFW